MRPQKARVRPIIFAALLGILLPPVSSLTHALLQDDGLALLGRGAAWARNHRLDGLVDKLEEWKYSAPPPKEAAESLAISTEMEKPSGIDVAALKAIVPQVSPALPNEGTWSVARSLGELPVVWVAGARTSQLYPSITTTFMLIDAKNVAARLYNGTEVPGGRHWIFGNKVADIDQPNLVAAFNGGFRLSHRAGGYYAEGETVMPLLPDKATIGIDRFGNFSMGIWGVTPFFNDASVGRWASLRQNLLPILIDGQLNPALKSGYWGGGGNGEIYILRSAVCMRRDGNIVFAISGMTDAIEIAKAMQLADCDLAMQLDQNASYPRGLTYEAGVPQRIDRRMAGKDNEYLRYSLRDFYAFFETE
ncbi:MAG: hypothetical protein RIR69_231 [Actinomycetota bacterium]